MSSEALDVILRTHLIEPDHLRNDDFEEFFKARIEALFRNRVQSNGQASCQRAGR